ncbi:hypothetical protein NS184_07860 [Curtobacterium luteum]|uniref:Uncharacterized protein n=1 Tax=Curtobacterium luteum TaxID=33881 RepID=A0A175RTP5_9MICO|nr:hypothetical protein NS184_07860 [Curtobacterium luteum]
MVTRGIRTRMSMRSRSGPESRARYRWPVLAEHSHGVACASPACPHGHGFAAIITWHCSGN